MVEGPKLVFHSLALKVWSESLHVSPSHPFQTFSSFPIPAAFQQHLDWPQILSGRLRSVGITADWYSLFFQQITTRTLPSVSVSVCVCVLTSRRICADIWGCMDVCAALSWDCNALSLEQKGRPVKYEADEQRLRLARVSQHTHTHTASLSSSQISAGSVD